MNNFLEITITSPILSAIVGIIVGIIGVMIGRSVISRVIRKRNAEEVLLQILQQDLEYRKFLVQRRNLLVHASQGKLDELETAELTKRIKEELADLDEPERENIAEALYQPSAQGRSNYVANLVEKSVEAPMNIEAIAQTLRDAVSNGILDKTTVEKAIRRWKQADAELEKAQNSREDRENRIAAALVEYNDATYEITKLYNKAIT